MAEFIERERILKKFCTNCYGFEDFCDTDCMDIRIIKSIPTADVQPVKHGKWLDLWIEADEMTNGGFMVNQCSVCKDEMYYGRPNGRPNYCPNCGAKMDS